MERIIARKKRKYKVQRKGMRRFNVGGKRRRTGRIKQVN